MDDGYPRAEGDGQHGDLALPSGPDLTAGRGRTHTTRASRGQVRQPDRGDRTISRFSPWGEDVAKPAFIPSIVTPRRQLSRRRRASRATVVGSLRFILAPAQNLPPDGLPFNRASAQGRTNAIRLGEPVRQFLFAHPHGCSLWSIIRRCGTRDSVQRKVLHLILGYGMNSAHVGLVTRSGLEVLSACSWPLV